MGIPVASGLGASGKPPAGDQANAVVTGKFSAVGPSACFAFYGAFNAALWSTTNTTLTTTANSSAATVASGTGLAAGQPISGVNVPAGTTVGAISGTNVTLAFPPGITNAQVATGADAAALFGGAAWTGSVQLERSFDGGATWVICGVGGAGQGAIYSGATLAGQAVSIVVGEPERQVLYRWNCTVLSSGTVNYRLSETGLMAVSMGVPPG